MINEQALVNFERKFYTIKGEIEFFAILQNRDTCDKQLIAVKIQKISSYCVKECATSCLEIKYCKFIDLKILN